MRAVLVLLLCVAVAVSAQTKPGSQPVKAGANKSAPTPTKPTTVKPPTTTTPTTTTPKPTTPAPKPGLNEACTVTTKAAKFTGFCRLPTNCGIGSKRYVAGICKGGVVCCVEQPAPHGPACPLARSAMQWTGSLKSGLDQYCLKVHKQSAKTCDARVAKKLTVLRGAINAACNKPSPKPTQVAPKPTTPKPVIPKPTTPKPTTGKKQGALVETGAAVEGDGLINRLADYFVQKAAGITKTEAANGCNFQTKMNCRAYITNCAMECMGEPMGTCQSCMDSYSGHPAGTFGQCCKCTDIVGQFGIPSCSY